MAATNVAVFACENPRHAATVLSYLTSRGVAGENLSLILVDEDYRHIRALDVLGSSVSSRQRLTSCILLVARNQPTLVVAGPVGACLFQTMQNETLFEGMGAIAGALYSLGMSRAAARAYETSALRGTPLVLVQGRACDVKHARELLSGAQNPLCRKESC